MWSTRSLLGCCTTWHAFIFGLIALRNSLWSLFKLILQHISDRVCILITHAMRQWRNIPRMVANHICYLAKTCSLTAKVFVVTINTVIEISMCNFSVNN